MKIFIGMETSGTARGIFTALGHDVVSCDILPADDLQPDGTLHYGGTHLTGDVFAALNRLARADWHPDAGLFHPTCTMHTVAAAWAFNEPDFTRYPGVGYHQRVQPDTLTGAARHAARAVAEHEVEAITRLPFFKLIENPKGTLPTRTRLGWVNDILQPYEFGHNASKATCIWAFDRNGDKVPVFYVPRNPRRRIAGRNVPFERAMGRARRPDDPVTIERWANQTDTGQNNMTPGAERWKDRSRSYPGLIAGLAQHLITHVTEAGFDQLETQLS